MARTGERQPSRSKARTWASVNTLGMASRLRLDEDRRVLRGPVAHVGGEVWTERPGARELEPQAQHVALLVGQGAVHEAGPRVERRVVVDELDVAPLEVHVEPQVGPARLLV